MAVTRAAHSTVHVRLYLCRCAVLLMPMIRVCYVFAMSEDRRRVSVRMEAVECYTPVEAC